MKKSLAALSLLLGARLLVAEDLHERAMRLHRSAIIVDTHEDVPETLEQHWVDISERNTVGHVDIPRWKEGGVTAPFLAAYVSADFAKPPGGSSKKALEFIDLIHRLVDANPKDLVFADSVAGIRQAKKDGKIAILIGIEGGHAIENSLGALSAFQRLGVRYMTLTHTNTNDWADSVGNFFSSTFDPKTYAVHNGLTDFGRDVVREMNRLGILVDVSHVSEKTMADAIAASKAPVFASHSSCRAISDMPRNVTDDQIRAIAKSGGVVMVNFSSLFLSQKAVDGYLAARKAIEPEVKAVEERFKDDKAARDAELKKVRAKIKYPDADWTAIADHIERVMKVGGPQSVGLGSDFDGIDDPPAGLEDVSRLPRLTEELLRRGHSDEEVRGILGENFLRFWDRAEAARKAMEPRKDPLPFSKPAAETD
jgi:membrane dipeptidase